MKKWKVILTIFVLIIAAGAGTIYYFLNIKEYKTKDSRVDKIVNSNYSIQLPDSTSKNNDPGQKTGSMGSGGSTGNADHNMEVSNLSNQQSSSTKANPSTAAKISSSSILEKYQPAFKTLESQANGKIDSLLSYAMGEYRTKKANGENVSYFYFYTKYSGAAKKLEATTDDSFHIIYNALVKDLRKNGYSASIAQPVEDQYNSMKKERSSAILKKAMSNL